MKSPEQIETILSLNRGVNEFINKGSWCDIQLVNNKVISLNKDGHIFLISRNVNNNVWKRLDTIGEALEILKKHDRLKNFI